MTKLNMSFVLRYLMLLAVVVWIGGIIFFSFGVAPVVFSVLPTRALAGAVVNRSLTTLHWMGLTSGIVFLACSLLSRRRLRLAQLLVAGMLALTAVSQFIVTPKMERLRQEMGIIDLRSPSDSRRVSFEELHQWSVRLEGGVLILGLIVLGSMVLRQEKTN
jgi:Domain of unknown function (DUF4149)